VAQSATIGLMRPATMTWIKTKDFHEEVRNKQTPQDSDVGDIGHPGLVGSRHGQSR
jgi:hypothetical protein